jgi:hypothetical protein
MPLKPFIPKPLFSHLPSYSSELNPDERLNADFKHALVSRVQVRTKDKLK